VLTEGPIADLIINVEGLIETPTPAACSGHR